MEYWKNLQKEDLEGEIWKTIKNCPNYNISNLGRLKSLKWTKGSYYKVEDYPLIMKQSLNHKGYCQTHIKDFNGKDIPVRIHRLVGEAFIENPNNLPQINHLDTIKTNNTVNNLEWSINLDNMRHAIEHGLRIDLAKGEKNGRALLKENEVIYIYTNPDRLTSKQLSDKYNVKMQTLLGIYSNKNWTYLTKDLKKCHINSNDRFIKIQYNDKKYFTNKLSDVVNISKLSLYKIRESIQHKKEYEGWKFEYITYNEYLESITNQQQGWLSS